MNGQRATGQRPTTTSEPAPGGTGVQSLAVSLYRADRAWLRPMTPEERGLLGLGGDGPVAALVIVRGGGWGEVHDGTRVWARPEAGVGPARYAPLRSERRSSCAGGSARLVDAIRPRVLSVYAGEQVTRRPATAIEAEQLRLDAGAGLYVIVRSHGALEHHPAAGLRLVTTATPAPAYYLDLTPRIAP